MAEKTKKVLMADIKRLEAEKAVLREKLSENENTLAEQGKTIEALFAKIAEKDEAAKKHFESVLRRKKLIDKLTEDNLESTKQIAQKTTQLEGALTELANEQKKNTLLQEMVTAKDEKFVQVSNKLREANERIKLQDGENERLACLVDSLRKDKSDMQDTIGRTTRAYFALLNILPFWWHKKIRKNWAGA